MKSLKGTRTEQNLMTAFAGESQARNKYTYFASKAKKDGFEQIAALFLKTAENERLGLLRHSHEFYGADLSALFSAMGSVMHTSYGNNRTCSQSLGLKKTAARLNRIIYNKIIFFVLPMHKNGIN